MSLYQCAELAIFPSLYEGYGLPVEESMACGAPTMAGDNSSLQEILPRDARFQPSDPGAIAEAIARGLTDKPFRDRLLALANQPPPTWGAVADKAVAVFEELSQKVGRFRPGWRRRPQLALVGVPPADAVAALTPTSTAWSASVDRYVNQGSRAQRRRAEGRRAQGRPRDGRRTEGRRTRRGGPGWPPPLERSGEDRPLAGRLRRHHWLATRDGGAGRRRRRATGRRMAGPGRCPPRPGARQVRRGQARSVQAAGQAARTIPSFSKRAHRAGGKPPAGSPKRPEAAQGKAR